MLSKNVLVFVALLTFTAVRASNDGEIYESADGICDKCNCTSENGALDDGEHGTSFTLDCSMKPFQRLFANWPEEMGDNHTGMELHFITSFSSIEVLHQLPTTEAKVYFTCRHCKTNEIVSHAFIDTPNIFLLDLSFNELESDDFFPDIFRGPENEEKYAPIHLKILVLRHNKIKFLDELIFEHTPDLMLLDLSNNPIGNFDESTSKALGVLNKLEILDLSFTGIEELAEIVLQNMGKLHEIFLNGNKFLTVPESLFTVGKTLEHLHLSENPIAIINVYSFNGLERVKHLNISSMPDLLSIEENSMKHLPSLEILHCRGNKKLDSFDMENLRGLRHLKELDVANNALTSLDFGDIAIEKTFETMKEIKEEHGKYEDQFKMLRSLKLAGNPWNCDCVLLNALSLFDHNAAYFSKSEKEDDARCKTPTGLASKFIYHLPFDHVCVTHGKQKIPIYDPPQFLRPKSIMLTVFSVIGVVVLGIFIGFGIVCIKRRLKRDEPGYSSSPIRYTTVRESTISNVVNSPYSP